MNKAMLFILSLFFSISASAATLNLSTAGSTGVNQTVNLNNSDHVIGSGTVMRANSSWSSSFDISTDINTPIEIFWSFNPERNLESATVSLFEIDGSILKQFDISSDFSFSAMLLAGVSYGLSIFNASSDELNYAVSASVSAVPVPAALFLFAPALIGLIGLRQKIKSDAE